MLIKQAEEKKKKEVSMGRKVLRAVPFILGAGAGQVAVNVAKENINKIQNPSIRKGLKLGLPLSAAIGAQILLPRIKKRIDEDIFQGKDYDNDKNT